MGLLVDGRIRLEQVEKKEKIFKESLQRENEKKRKNQKIKRKKNDENENIIRDELLF